MSQAPAPGEDAAHAKKRALEHRCPTCAAESGDVCRDLAGGGFLYALHGARFAAAGVVPPTQPSTGITP